MTRRFTPLLPRAYWLLLALLLVGSPALAQEPAWDIEQRVGTSADDSEEFLADSADDPQRWPAGFSYAESSDLELGRDAAHAPQVVALRFGGLQIPPGARVEQAVLEFTADRDQAGPLSLTIATQDDVATERFIQDEDGQGSFDLSSRPKGAFRQTWQPEPWTGGQAYRSPDIAGLVQELVNRDEWQSDGSIVLLLSPANGGGGGLRSAHAFDSNPRLAPRLLVNFSGTGVGAGEGVERAEAEPIQPVPEAEEPIQPEPVVPGDPSEAEQAEADQAAPEQAEADEAAADVPEIPAEAEPVDPEPDAGEAPAETPPGQRQPVQVVPVDPDPILPPRRGEAPQSVWPGQAAPDDEEGEQMAPAREPAEEAGAGQLAEAEVAEDEERLAAPRRMRFPVARSFARGVEGSVLLSDYGSGVTVATVFLDNPLPGVTYPASIRRGECGSSGQLVVDLEPVAGSRAFSTSLLSLEFDQLVAGEYHLNVYRITDDFTRVSGCAFLGGG